MSRNAHKIMKVSSNIDDSVSNEVDNLQTEIKKTTRKYQKKKPIVINQVHTISDSNSVVLPSNTMITNAKSNDEVNGDNNVKLQKLQQLQDTEVMNVTTLKKRGRKPKGGKILPTHNKITYANTYVVKNIVLHLRCNKSDLEKSELDESVGSISGFSIENKNKSEYGRIVDVKDEIAILDDGKSEWELKKKIKGEIKIDGEKVRSDVKNEMETNKCEGYMDHVYRDEVNKMSVEGRSMVNNKIKELQYNFYHNTTYDKQSACFWCSYGFANEAYFLPMYVDNNNCYHVYGHFCAPECALSYLMNQNIDISVKYERSSLLHALYMPLYEYKASIIPAPSPHYLLQKYSGNLTIDEYRSLFHNDKIIMVLQKPITKIYPEIHEDNTDFIMKSKIIPMNSTNDGGYQSKIHNYSLSNFMNQSS